MRATTLLMSSLGAASSATADPLRSTDRAARLLIYDIALAPAGGVLSVEATFPPGAATNTLIGDPAAARFVEHLEVAPLRARARFRPASRDTRSKRAFSAPGCASGCRVRYRFDLMRAAAELDHPGIAALRNGAILAPPSTWLVRPETSRSSVRARDRYRFRVSTPPGVSFATGVLPSEAAPGSYEADAALIDESPFSAFGRLRSARLEDGGGAIEVRFLPGRLDAGDAEVLAWIQRAAGAVSLYYGRFPVPRVLVLIVPASGARPSKAARTLGHGGATILVPLGSLTDDAALARDWIMTHEMLHLGFPNLAPRHRWLEEGIATYVEPIARARAGQLGEEGVWADLFEGLQLGEPTRGGRGLDDSPSWARTYWGGAGFCLLADVEIRRRTNNTRSLDHALRAILAAGGSTFVDWPIERALAIGDRAVGVPVLSDLYASLGRSRSNGASTVELLAKLGVKRSGRGSIVLDDGAPLSAIRRAITRAPETVASSDGRH